MHERLAVLRQRRRLGWRLYQGGRNLVAPAIELKPEVLQASQRSRPRSGNWSRLA